MRARSLRENKYNAVVFLPVPLRRQRFRRSPVSNVDVVVLKNDSEQSARDKTVRVRTKVILHWRLKNTYFTDLHTEFVRILGSVYTSFSFSGLTACNKSSKKKKKNQNWFVICASECLIFYPN